MAELETGRYKINFTEVKKGGPGGYESTYLTSEGDPASRGVLSLIRGLNGRLLPAESLALRQRNGKVLFDALSKGRKMGIASGFKPSGAYHFGHRLTSSTVAFFQRNGVQAFIPVADLECSLDAKVDRDKSSFWAADNLVDWGANGVDLDAAHVYLQSEEFRVSQLAYVLARGLDFGLAVNTYGMEKLCGDPKKPGNRGEFPFLFAGMTQVGDIVLPQHPDFGNYHSFMVSGQDQDGHMKMTVELVSRALQSGVSLPGVKTVPSGFYIPHIRGVTGRKQSSSRPEGTLYLGPGPNGLNIQQRRDNARRVLDSALADPKTRDFALLGALDMVRYIDFFNGKGNVDFGEAMRNMPRALRNRLKMEGDGEKRSALIDGYLMDECLRLGQNNFDLVRDTIGDALVEHQRRREVVMQYAKDRSSSGARGRGLWSPEAGSSKPDFWHTPPSAVVDVSKRNATQWYNIVADMGDRLTA